MGRGQAWVSGANFWKIGGEEGWSVPHRIFVEGNDEEIR